MSARENSLGQDLLPYYGTNIAEYRGKGVLTLKGGKTVNCKFEAGQLATGNVLLLCDFIPPIDPRLSISADTFEGTTTEDFQISGEVTNEVRYLPDLPRDQVGEWRAFRLHDMSVQMLYNSDGATKARFGITNFEFTGTQGFRTVNRFYLMLPLILKYQDNVTNLSIVPREDYDRIIQPIKVLKGIDVTCEALADIPKEGITRLTETIDNLCYLLSVARGTKIQWIYRDLYDEAGKLIQRTHCSRITKPFCPLPIIDPAAVDRNETKAFIEQAYPIYLEKKESWKLDRGTIDAYLDAKAERDYLQMRGVKLAVAMEMLKSVFLELPECPVAEHIISEQQFKNLRPRLKEVISEVLKTEAIGASSRGRVHEKIGELNRISFKYLLEHLYELVHLQVKKQDLKLFIACRNKLVHKGRFYCESAKPEEQKKCTPLPSKVDEYFFLVNFLDRVFLKLLDYSGPYINWRTPGKPVREEL